MRGFPLRISKEKILSLRSSKIKDLQNRPKTFQLLAQFAIKIPEYSTPYYDIDKDSMKFTDWLDFHEIQRGKHSGSLDLTKIQRH